MVGYSGTPLPRKLWLRPGARFGLINPPPAFARTLGELPPGVRPTAVSAGKSRFDVIVCFAPTMAEIARRVPALKARLDPAGGLWLAWPKKASGVATDVTEDTSAGGIDDARVLFPRRD